MTRQYLPRCPAYEKRSFATKDDASRFLTNVGKDGPQDPLKQLLPNRAFRCDKCPHWHVASKMIPASATGRRRGTGKR